MKYSSSIYIIVLFTNVILLTLLFRFVHSSDPVVKLRSGDIRGLWKLSSKGREYASFRGVPYAKPPKGEYRFKPPEQLQSWDGVWNATAPGSCCLQYHPFENKTLGSEDCLFLNIYTPKLDPATSLPVIIYFHGGAFMYGNSDNYQPTLLMDRDLVVVTVNYRLGPFGFLSTGDEVAPGNLGLKDQVFAIKWVKENIQVFGGNPDGITLLGHSAGGSSVHYHYMSPLSQDLFARGIALSGSAFCPWAYSTRPVHKAKRLGALLGCPTNSSREMMSCLMTKPGADITDAQSAMLSWKVKMFTMFTPTVEPKGTQGAFLAEQPYIATRTMKKAPIITSVTSEEGLYPGAGKAKGDRGGLSAVVFRDFFVKAR